MRRALRQLGSLLAILFTVAPAHALDMEQYPELRAFIKAFSGEHKYSETELRSAFMQVRIRPEITEAMERPREAQPYYEYRKQFLTDTHLKRGAEFWTQNAAALARHSKKYGVQPEIIVAILGVETQYGRNKGEYPVLDALTTLWLHHPPRSDFFKRELEEFLLLAREQRLDLTSVKGSYAGAIGMPQFISSSYRRYAVDGDGDGKRDLLKNPDDAIASVGNFLAVHGWVAGEAPIDDVELRGTLYFWIERLGVKPALTMSGLTQYGIVPRNAVSPERRAALIAFEGEAGPFYRLGYNNFYVITRYNRSKRYAMAVVELAERLRRNRE
ncbi:MAG TPA: lytic murein transglycosylase B [Burkholderiales bacterium]|nr:lytic murein transglycosylase B [Burkholderiales bacterium]